MSEVAWTFCLIKISLFRQSLKMVRKCLMSDCNFQLCIPSSHHTLPLSLQTRRPRRAYQVWEPAPISPAPPQEWESPHYIILVGENPSNQCV